MKRGVPFERPHVGRQQAEAYLVGMSLIMLTY
jgi:hypothetical protein